MRQMLRDERKKNGKTTEANGEKKATEDGE